MKNLFIILFIFGLATTIMAYNPGPKERLLYNSHKHWLQPYPMQVTLSVVQVSKPDANGEVTRTQLKHIVTTLSGFHIDSFQGRNAWGQQIRPKWELDPNYIEISIPHIYVKSYNMKNFHDDWNSHQLGLKRNAEREQ